MHQYSGVDVVFLDDPQNKCSKGATNSLEIKKDAEQKKYCVAIKSGKTLSKEEVKQLFSFIQFRSISDRKYCVR